MMYDSVEGCQTYRSLADIGMSVFGSAPFIHAVIDMEDGDLIFADETVEFIDDAIEIIYDIMPRIVHMTSVKTDP